MVEELLHNKYITTQCCYNIHTTYLCTLINNLFLLNFWHSFNKSFSSTKLLSLNIFFMIMNECPKITLFYYYIMKVYNELSVDLRPGLA